MAIGLGASLAACSPREGGACNREGAGHCLDTTRALTCREGRWRVLPCRGGAGCSTNADALQCDRGAGREGEPCAALEQRTCSEAGAARPGVLVCLQGTSPGSTGSAWAREASCLGPGGCRTEGAKITCDDSRAEPGALCLRAGQLACDVTGASLLRCQDGRFAVERACTRCAVDGDAGISCD